MTSAVRRFGLRVALSGVAIALLGLAGTSLGEASPPIEAARTAAAPRAETAAPIAFRIGSFNVLGSWHTRAGHLNSMYTPGPMRAHLAAEVIRIYNPGVAGLQEPEFDQIPVMAAELPDHDFWPGTALGDQGVRNTIVWDTRRFTKTAQGYVDTIFLGMHRYQPYVRLRHDATGRQFWVMNVHNTPKRGSDSSGADERAAQLRAEAARIRSLEQTGLPVLMTGDFNDKVYTYCYIVSNTMMRAPQGYPGGCTLPSNSHIEWIFGTRGRVSWSDYKYDYGPLISRVTDHDVPWVTATLN